MKMLILQRSCFTIWAHKEIVFFYKIPKISNWTGLPRGNTHKGGNGRFSFWNRRDYEDLRHIQLNNISKKHTLFTSVYNYIITVVKNLHVNCFKRLLATPYMSNHDLQTCITPYKQAIRLTITTIVYRQIEAILHFLSNTRACAWAHWFVLESKPWLLCKLCSCLFSKW